MKTIFDKIFYSILTLSGLFLLYLVFFISSEGKEVLGRFFVVSLSYYEKVIIYYLLLGNSLYLIILAFGYINSRRKYIGTQLKMDTRLTPLKKLTPISILMPAYNEEANIITSIKSMININYPEFEIVVCNDGSKDDSMKVMIDELSLYEIELQAPQSLPCNKVIKVYKSKLSPIILVLDKVNGGKSDALNAAINYSKYPLICCVDCDSILDAEGLTRVVVPFIEDPDNTVAVGGVIRLANDTRIENNRILEASIPWKWLSIVQVVEYLRAFLVGRMGWDYIGCNTIISGAFGLFSKKDVISAGGYDCKTIGEDFELLLRMHSYGLKHKKNHQVVFLPDPVCWTEAPEDLKTLGNQRSRWQQGLGESLWRSKSLVFSPWGGRIGWISLPYLWAYELMSAPLELLGYIILIGGLYFDLFEFDMAIMFLAVSTVYGCTLSLGAVITEELTFRRYTRTRDLIKLFLGTVLEQIGFRQLHLYWRTRGMIRWLRKKNSWGEMKRVGLKKKP